MGENTAITWAHHTYNPWHGCQRVSPGCVNCYAERTGARFGTEWGPTAPRRFFGEDHWNEPRKWNRKAQRANERHRVFCASMADVFENRPELVEHRERLWALIRETPCLDWLLLTKRPENMAAMLPWVIDGTEPWSNVWLGVTAEDTERADERIPILRGIPAAVRFVSCEPILEHIGSDTWDLVLGTRGGMEPIHWIIVGDESGPRARPAEIEWVRTVRRAAQRHNVAFHFKQWCGEDQPGIGHDFGDDRNRRKIHLPILDGRRHAAFPTGDR